MYTCSFAKIEVDMSGPTLTHYQAIDIWLLLSIYVVDGLRNLQFLIKKKTTWS